MNVMVTGASGFVGMRLIEALSEDVDINNIFALYRNKEQIAFLPKINPVLGNLDTLASMKIDARIDMMIHLAGYFRTESKSICEAVNVRGTENVITFCKNNGIGKILFYSTINVNLQSKGCYAQSKLKAEGKVKNSGLEYMIIRPALVFDGRQGSLGKIIGYTEKLPLVPVFGSGKAKEQPIHMKELIALTLLMIKDFKPGKTLYAAGRNALALKEMVKTIGGAMHKNTAILPIPAKPIYWLLKLAEKTGIHSGISSEQIAHMSEDLTADMAETLVLYPVELQPFEEHIKSILH